MVGSIQKTAKQILTNHKKEYKYVYMLIILLLWRKYYLCFLSLIDCLWFGTEKKSFQILSIIYYENIYNSTQTLAYIKFHRIRSGKDSYKGGVIY